MKNKRYEDLDEPAKLQETIFISNVEEDPNTKDLLLTFPPEMISKLDWKTGDVLDFENSGGQVFIVNKSLAERQNEEKLFIVETVQTFKMRYAVKGKSLEHAMDSITCNEVNEIDQEYLGETIFSGREVFTEEFLQKETKSEWLANLTDEEKLKLIHHIDYETVKTAYSI